MKLWEARSKDAVFYPTKNNHVLGFMLLLPLEVQPGRKPAQWPSKDIAIAELEADGWNTGLVKFKSIEWNQPSDNDYSSQSLPRQS